MFDNHANIKMNKKEGLLFILTLCGWFLPLLDIRSL